MEKYDICFIGGGPAGYTGALRARSYGMRTLLVEKHLVGGVCLHLGCIPTKAMVASGALADKIQRAVQFGLDARLDGPHKLAKIAATRDAIVAELSEGLTQTLKKNGVEMVKGKASFKKARVIAIESVPDSVEVEAETIVIATGARPQNLPGIAFNEKNILSSDDILDLREVPARLGIIGGGVVGCEFASLFASLGSKVYLVEMMPQLIPSIDRDLTKRLEVLFKRRGVQVFTGRTVEKLSTDGAALNAVLNGGERFSCDKLLVSVGRKRNTEDLGLEMTRVKCDGGIIRVDEFLETGEKGVFAIGDVIGSPQLAHVAEAEALHVVDHLSRPSRPMDYTGWPNVVFTHPEIAAAGLTREEAERLGMKVVEYRHLYGALGKAHVEREPDGMIKLVFDESSGQILGGHILGDRAADLIAEISLAVRLKATREDLAATIHAHPTYSEIIWDAARSAAESRVSGNIA